MITDDGEAEWIIQLYRYIKRYVIFTNTILYQVTG